MGSKQELEISISHDGNVTINVIGAKGKSCMDITKDIEESLGVVLARETKPSFYETDTTSSTKISERDL